MYTKNLRASRGTDNVILIEFRNQDQKRVDITGLTFTCRLISREGDRLLLTKDLVIANAERGQANLTLTELELDRIAPQLANYSITVDSPNEVVFVDDNAGGRGVIDIEDAAYPRYIPSLNVTIPPSMPAASSRNFQDPPEHPTTVSSEWNPLEVQQTMQYKLNGFEGIINIQAMDPKINNGIWFELDTIEYTDVLGTTGTYGLNFEGLYPRLRLKIDTIQGEVSDVYVR